MAKIEGSGWDRCPTGELVELENRLWNRWLRRVVVTAATALVAAGAVTVAATQVVPIIFSSRPSAGHDCCPTPTEPCLPDPCPQDAPDPKSK